MNLAEQNRKRLRSSQPRRQPISRHPLFPAVVALWVAALFGMAGMVMPSSLLEATVQAVHVDALVSAAALPLGLVARILFALALAGIGGVAGAVIARRIARPRPMADDTAVETENTESAVIHRRALALDEYGDAGDQAGPVPLPGDAPQVLSLAELSLDGFEDQPEQAAEAEEAEPVSASRDEAVQPVVQVVEPQVLKIFPRLYVTDEQPADPVAAAPAAAAPAVIVPQTVEDEAVLPASEAMEQPEALDRPVETEEAELVPATLPPASPPPVAGPVSELAALAEICLAEGVATADMEGLSYPELLDRLSLALQRRRGRRGPGTPPAASPPSPDCEAGSLACDSPEQESDDEEAALHDFITPRQIITPSFAALADYKDMDDEAVQDEADDEESEDAYGSLLDFSRPAPLKQSCIRMPEPEPEMGDDDPVVLFPGRDVRRDHADGPFADIGDLPETECLPGQEAVASSAAGGPDSEETERALREALAALQRMSRAG